jgi:hypothetical protein
MRKRLILRGLVGALTVTASAGGFVAGRIFTVRPGDRADIRIESGTWSCFNVATFVRCQGGDALPYAELTATRHGGATVRVYTLRDPQGGHLTRTYRSGYPV